ncbi:MAG: AzlD domain-containing protein [Deltaproteobacteria bacterium]|jgi:branched-subunit amino acid transport protein|nr:AzlD domain-containing protein [Deltaproteobacteria bacterium]
MSGFWLALLLAAGGTMALRSFALSLKKPLSPPPKVADAMNYVPVSVLAALVFHEFFLGGAALFPRLAAALAALALALAFGRDLLTIAGGLLVFWLLDVLGAAPF